MAQYNFSVIQFDDRSIANSFPLNQPFVVKLTQLDEFDKTSDA